MQLERRQSPRIKLDHLAYINLPAANGGIVLDVSEGGLSFHSVVPIEATDVVRFRLAVGTIKNLEATATVAWLDSTRKSGGLQFTSLPTEVRWQIENWVREANSAGARKEQENRPEEAVAAAPAVLIGPMPPAPGVIAETDNVEQVTGEGPGGVPVTVPAAISSDQPAGAPTTSVDKQFTLGGGTTDPIAEAGKEFTPATPLKGNAPALRNPLSMFPADSVEMEREPVARRHSFSIVAGILVLACVVATGTLTYTYRGDAGAWLVWLGQKVSGRGESNLTKSAPATAANVPSAAQTPDQNSLQAGAPPAAVPSTNATTGPTTGAVSGAPATPTANPSSASHIPARNSGGAAEGAETGKPPVKAAGGQNTESAGTQGATNGAAADASGGGTDGDYGASELALARKYLRDAQSPADTATAAQLLWISIEKGNTNAEVELAGLYARGEGVQKSCEQARILLTAAVNKGNATARQKLDELKTNGCS